MKFTHDIFNTGVPIIETGYIHVCIYTSLSDRQCTNGRQGEYMRTAVPVLLYKMTLCRLGAYFPYSDGLPSREARRVDSSPTYTIFHNPPLPSPTDAALACYQNRAAILSVDLGKIETMNNTKKRMNKLSFDNIMIKWKSLQNIRKLGIKEAKKYCNFTHSVLYYIQSKSMI